mmetsp:Transcript_2633/g.4080  ORF Transcript_2633/g.4080 Transcript_2633/m.4080 type:complete len:151 (+) Transcript_2633:1704-2156(+)
MHSCSQQQIPGSSDFIILCFFWQRPATIVHFLFNIDPCLMHTLGHLLCPMESTNSSFLCKRGTFFIAANLSSFLCSMLPTYPSFLDIAGTSFMTADFYSPCCPMPNTNSSLDGSVGASFVIAVGYYPFFFGMMGVPKTKYSFDDDLGASF